MMLFNTHIRILKMNYNVFTLTIRKTLKFTHFVNLLLWGLGLQVCEKIEFITTIKISYKIWT